MQTEAVVLAVVDSLSAAGRRDVPHVSNLARSAYKFSNLTKASVPAACKRPQISPVKSLVEICVL